MRSTHCEKNMNVNKQNVNFDIFRLYPVTYVWQLNSDCVHGFIPFEREIVRKKEQEKEEDQTRGMHVSKMI